jgi:hypothetical protein
LIICSVLVTRLPNKILALHDILAICYIDARRICESLAA